MRITRTPAAIWLMPLLLLADPNAAAPPSEDGRTAALATGTMRGGISPSIPTSSESDRHQWWPSGFLPTGERVVRLELGAAARLAAVAVVVAFAFRHAEARAHREEDEQVATVGVHGAVKHFCF